MISLLLPTRGRPTLFKTLCESAFKMAVDSDNLEVVSYHDTDDNSEYEYIGNHREVIGDRINLLDTFNKCYKVARGPIYMFIADDFQFKSPGWDLRVLEAFDAINDKIAFVYVNSHYRDNSFGMTGFLHKNWIDTVGYLFYPSIDTMGDNWVNTVANMIGRKIFLSDVIVEHQYITNDITHAEFVARFSNGRNHKHEYFRLRQNRIDDAKKLAQFIDEYNDA